MLVDLHVKSSVNDGVSVSAEAIIKCAKERGLDAVAFTESDRTSHAHDLLQLGVKYGIKVFIGIEISTDLGILICFPPKIDEFLLEEEWRRANELTIPAADYVIEMIEEIGGAVIASRPYDLEIPHNMGDWVFRIDGINAIEVFNPRVGQIQSDFAQEAAQALGIPITGGSDPSNSLKNIGQYATFFPYDFETQADFVYALKNSDYNAIIVGEVEQERSSRPQEDSSNRKHHANDRSDKSSRNNGNKSNNRRERSHSGNSHSNRRHAQQDHRSYQSRRQKSS